MRDAAEGNGLGGLGGAAGAAFEAERVLARRNHHDEVPREVAVGPRDREDVGRLVPGRGEELATRIRIVNDSGEGIAPPLPPTLWKSSCSSCWL